MHRTQWPTSRPGFITARLLLADLAKVINLRREFHGTSVRIDVDETQCEMESRPPTPSATSSSSSLLTLLMSSTSSSGSINEARTCESTHGVVAKVTSAAHPRSSPSPSSLPRLPRRVKRGRVKYDGTFPHFFRLFLFLSPA